MTNKNSLRKIKVLQVSNVASITTKAFFIPLAKELKKQGYDITFALAPGEYLNGFKETGFPVKTFPIDRKIITFNHLLAIWRMYRFMKKEKFHIVHTHTPIASVLARIAAKLARIPIIIYHVRGTYFDSKNWFKYPFLLIEKILGRFTTFVFTINSEDAKDMVRHKIISKEKLLSLNCGGSGINLKIYNPERIDNIIKENLRRDLGINRDDKVIGFIGRMVYVKGILDLVEAFKIISKNYPKVKLLMIGDVLKSERDHSTFEKFKKLMVKYKLEDKIILTGFRKDIPELISLMDILVLPSHMEWFGLTLGEAAAMQKPAVATSTRGAREAIVNGETGFLVPIKNPFKLAESVLLLLMDESLTKEMGKKARRRAEQLFDEKKIISKEIRIYERLIREKFQQDGI